MGDVLTFAPRPKPAALPPAPEPLTAADPVLRARIEAAAEVAVDTAQRLIAILDRMDGCPDIEDDGDAEPSLGAPENHHSSQVVWLRGGDEDREIDAGEAVLPEVALADMATTADVLAPDLDTEPPAIVIPLPLVPRDGRGSMVTAAAITLFDLVAGQG